MEGLEPSHPLLRQPRLPALRYSQLSAPPQPRPEAIVHPWTLKTTTPPNAPQPDYGDFWQRYPNPPADLIAPLSSDAPVEAILYGPRVRAIMGRLTVDEYLPDEGARLSQLVPVHRAKYDLAYELDLLRQLDIANEQTLKEFGPRPGYTPPPQPWRKPNLPKTIDKFVTPPIPAETTEATPEETQPIPQGEDEMNLKQVIAAGTLAVAGVTAALTGGCVTGPRMADHGFSFDGWSDEGRWVDKVDLLEYDYGGQYRMVQDKVKPPKESLPASTGVTGSMPIGDYLYVKWRIKSTNEIYDNRVNLKPLLPIDMNDYRLTFVIDGQQLYVYLVTPEKRHGSNTPPLKTTWSRDFITYEIYPNNTFPSSGR
jgi:hypothetical protein